jgi:hypothetical protein
VPYYHEYEPCPNCDQDPCECETNVCQNCGGYFIYTAALQKTWIERWQPSGKEQQPQRCRSCLVDETWVERRDE